MKRDGGVSEGCRGVHSEHATFKFHAGHLHGTQLNLHVATQKLKPELGVELSRNPTERLDVVVI